MVDCLLSVFEFGSVAFVEAREAIWLNVFDHACRSRLPALSFTFAPERGVRPQFIPEVLAVFRRGEGEVEFMRLVCPLAELRLRMGDLSRERYGKLTSLSLFEQLHADGVFDSSSMPEPRLTLDTSLCSPKEATFRIVRELGIALLERPNG